MRAMILPAIVSLDEVARPLQLADLPVPRPGPSELLVRIKACGVCHTELDEIEGRTPPPRLPVVPGHEVVGIVEATGPAVRKWEKGQRVGVGWIHSSSGAADENISTRFQATGRDVNGGYAEYMTVPEEYAFAIPAVFGDAEAAPLLCAGAVGFRALKLTGLQDGQRLGLTGFGGSAHLVLQLVRHLFPHTETCVFARDPAEREFALQLGAAWAGAIEDRAPEALHAIIDTTPVWKPVVEALANLRPGGRLVINAIRKEDVDKDYLQNLSYAHHLWLEREIKTVANVTRFDLQEFLPLAAEIPLRPEITTFPLESANEALRELKRGSIQGAKVLVPC
ncbi:MAG: alcohol dehydrogenase catalytic domain-containing protein [Planctomycetales bacterium]|nr:alcohol dehydrogenase catalytic domain-containing protein [Planctomycetales bacterium]NIM08743.1 alcohol dehydrogenase catalytic domain-containing protein [Planctomycetales bacterium]NIN08211.1 alcohol dehydrogenase catalytic domain-containing protein [Planctomycetales bacterium]NIN77339.1 alcohol dehydrogenase catalytic domain-containing protein [Planctomycetales bacterium]NIO34523.1 alcohol dehydrogenase catalytic domain-containing protein [Planctomycetales bacterium]